MWKITFFNKYELQLAKFKSKKKLSIGIGIIFVVVITAVSISQITAKKNEFKTVNNPEKAVEVAKSLVEIVGKIYELPNEIPTIATITDTKELPVDPFYIKAKNGDKILIFSSAGEIIMYRPSTNRVIDVGQVAAAPEPTSVPRVAGSSTTASPSAQKILSSTPSLPSAPLSPLPTSQTPKLQ